MKKSPMARLIRAQRERDRASDNANLSKWIKGQIK